MLLAIAETERPVDTDGVVFGVRVDEQGARAELRESVLACGEEQMACKALAPVRGMGVDGLKTGKPGSGAEDPQPRMHLTLAKRTEPGTVPLLADAPGRVQPALDKLAMPRSVPEIVVRHPQVGCLSPVAVAGHAPERRRRWLSGGPPHGGGAVRD